MTTNDTTADLRTPDYGARARLDGKVFVVFGAGQGIGRETAHALSQSGARVVCVGRRREPTEAIAGEVGGVASLGDATVRADVERIFAEAEAAYGQVNGLVDILGEPRLGALKDVSDADWDWQFDIGVRHVFLTAQIGLALIGRHGGGVAVYVSSIAGMFASRNQIAYGASKAALQQFVRSAAVEFGPAGVRVNAVVPGVIRTPRVLQKFSPETLRNIDALYPLGAAGVPADIASAILFMASPLSRHVTGQSLLVDGGVTLRSPFHDVGTGGPVKTKETLP